MHETSARAWCTGKTQKNRVEREMGVGIGMGDTCNSMADSCQCMRDPGLIPGLGRSPREGNGYPSSILAWRIPRTEEPGGLQSIASQTVRHD